MDQPDCLEEFSYQILQFANFVVINFCYKNPSCSATPNNPSHLGIFMSNNASSPNTLLLNAFFSDIYCFNIFFLNILLLNTPFPNLLVLKTLAKARFIRENF